MLKHHYHFVTLSMIMYIVAVFAMVIVSIVVYRGFPSSFAGTSGATVTAGSDFLSASNFGTKGDCSKDDTSALQAVINAAKTSDYRGKTILLKRNGCYRISKSLIFQDMQRGKLIGNNARIEWWGANRTASALSFSDVRDMVFENFTLSAKKDLDTAITTVNGQNTIVVPTNLTFRNVVIDGGAGKLKVGFRAALGAGGDANNDLHVLDHVTIAGFTDAGVRLEASQVHYVKLLNYTCNPYASAPSTYCAYSVNGSFIIHGGSSSGARAADFYVSTPHTALFISNWNSKGSARLLATGGPSGAPQPAKITGTIFDSSAIAADRVAIDFRFPGPLTVENSIIGTANNPRTLIKITAYVPTFTILRNTHFGVKGSFEENPLVLNVAAHTNVEQTGNTFINSQGQYVDQSGSILAGSPPTSPMPFPVTAYITASEEYIGNAVPNAVHIADPAKCTTDATAAFRSAINTALDPTTRVMRPIVLENGGCYNVSGKLRISGASSGKLVGNNAAIHWTGDSTTPLLLLNNSHNLLIENLYIQSTPSHTLTEGIRIINTVNDLNGPTDNTLRNIIIDGVNTNGLVEGIKIADTATDAFPNVLDNVEIFNYNNKGITFTTTKRIQFFNIACIPAASVSNSYCMYMDEGAFNWLGSSGGYNTASDIYLNKVRGTINIVNLNSEGSKRTLQTADSSLSADPILMTVCRHSAHVSYSDFDNSGIDYRLTNPFRFESNYYGEASIIPKISLGGLSGTVTTSIKGNVFGALGSVNIAPIIINLGTMANVTQEINAFITDGVSAER